jgi:hypothetical protein
MALNVTKEVAAMERMTTGELVAKYAEVCGEATRSRHKQYLIRRIAWRMQANVEGGLSERALQRARELANDADLRVTAPRVAKLSGSGHTKIVTANVRPAGVPMASGTLTREYKGRTIVVTVLENGYAFEGERYRSLSAIAKAVTGAHWNGHLFFGLRKGGQA